MYLWKFWRNLWLSNQRWWNNKRSIFSKTRCIVGIEYVWWLCLDSVGWLIWSMDRYMASEGKLWRRTWPYLGRRYERVAVRLSLAACCAQCLRSPQRLCRRYNTEWSRSCFVSAYLAERSSLCLVNEPNKNGDGSKEWYCRNV